MVRAAVKVKDLFVVTRYQTHGVQETILNVRSLIRLPDVTVHWKFGEFSAFFLESS